MRKLLFFSMALAAIAAVTSCDCKKGGQTQIETSSALVVENIVSSDREAMFLEYGGKYTWYETTVKMKNFLDAECQDGEAESVRNTFYYVFEYEDGSFSGKVVEFEHTAFINQQLPPRYGIWVGDYALNDENVKITFGEAYGRLMEANCAKPHSRYCVLRKEVGPVAANPQYVFGNIKSQVYVDAVTGKVSLTNPAFDGFKSPLGEWP